MHDIFEKALVQYRDQLEGKTFCVRVKRRGKHDFSSIDVERYVGGDQHIESATNPEVTVHLEVEDDRLLLIKGRYEGIGGFPIDPGRCVVAHFRWFRLRCFQLYVDASRLPRALLLL